MSANLLEVPLYTPLSIHWEQKRAKKLAEEGHRVNSKDCLIAYL